jgi:bifunctional non-homologous end joining protein LigD
VALVTLQLQMLHICYAPLRSFAVEFSAAIVSRNKKELTARFPEPSTIHQAIKAKSAILDGEIVGLYAKGRPCFGDLQNRLKCRIVYFAFDLLTVNHKDLRNEPLLKRKETLKTIITSSHHHRI